MSRNLDFSTFYDAKPDGPHDIVSMYGVHWRGNDVLEAVFRDSGVFNADGVEQPQRFLFKNVGGRRDLAAALARGYYLAAERRAPPTRAGYHAFTRPFFAFLHDIDPDRTIKSLEQINTALVNRYIVWISGRQVKAPGGAMRPMSRSYKDSLYSSLRANIDALRRDGRNDLSPDCDFHKNPWSNEGIKAHGRMPSKQQILTDPQLRCIHAACQMEIETIIRIFDETETKIRSVENLGNPDGDGLHVGNEPQAYAYIARRYGGCVPSWAWASDNDPALLAAFRTIGGRGVALKNLGATPETLLPFILVLLMRTFFNPDALMGIKDSFCREAHWLWGGANWEILSGDLSQDGEKELARLINDGIAPEAAIRTVLSSYKGRKRDMVTRTFRDSGSWDSPPTLIGQVRRLTSRHRERVADIWRDRLFLFQINKGASDAPRSFMDELGPSSDSVLASTLKRFRERHLIDPFTFTSFRLTGADIVWETTDGDASAVAAMLGNEIKTTDAHYNTPGNVLRAEHRIAVMTNRRVRMIDTGGRSRLEHTACTPGFHCIDPYNSPQPGQREGVLCTAYPSCPMCPLASLDASKAGNVAWLINLQQSIQKSSDVLDPARHHLVYRPILDQLESRWLSRVAPDVMREANTLSVGLPPLPEME